VYTNLPVLWVRRKNRHNLFRLIGIFLRLLQRPQSFLSFRWGKSPTPRDASFRWLPHSHQRGRRDDDARPCTCAPSMCTCSAHMLERMLGAHVHGLSSCVSSPLRWWPCGSHLKLASLPTLRPAEIVSLAFTAHCTRDQGSNQEFSGQAYDKLFGSDLESTDFQSWNDLVQSHNLTRKATMQT